jgi:hypothetical protein
MSLDLTNEEISQTFQRVVQYESGSFYDGLGNSISTSVSYLKLSDVSASYAYCGTAISGSLTSNPNWKITRIFVSSSGNTESKYAYNAIWNDRYTTVYN